MNILGEKIKALRKEKNITQDQLAQDLHTAKSTIGMWENGRRIPDLDTIKKIANYFNKTVDYLTNEYIVINKIFHDGRIPETMCPICGYDYIHFVKAFSVEFPNVKSDGICLQFYCESEHNFYLIIEDYKGNSYMTYLDENFEEIGNAEIFDSNTNIVYKYDHLDEYGRDMVNTILEKEYQRCKSQKNHNIDISSYTQSIAAGTGGEGFDDEKINEVNDFARKIAELENNSE